MSIYYLKSITKRRLEFGTSGCTCKSGVIPRFIEALRMYLWLYYLLFYLSLNERDFIQILLVYFLVYFRVIYFTYTLYTSSLSYHHQTTPKNTLFLPYFSSIFHHQKHKKTQTTWFYQFYSNSFCNLFEFFPLNSLVKLTTHIFLFNQWFPYTFLYFPSKTCVFYSKMHRTLSSPILSYPLLSSPPRKNIVRWVEKGWENPCFFNGKSWFLIKILYNFLQ